jgi:hypothetical protein
MEVVGITVTGNVGFEASPGMFRVYVGYPDALTGTFGVNLTVVKIKIKAEYGTEFQVGGEHGAHAKMKQRYEAEAQADFAITYVKSSMYIGAEGIIKLLKPTGVEFSIEACLGGKIVGGIRFFGNHDIIRLQLDAMGRMRASLPPPEWQLTAKCTVAYGINLGFLGSVSGSKSMTLDKTISL